MTPQEFTDLLDRYRLGTATPEETEKVEAWYATMENNNAALSREESAVHHNAILKKLQAVVTNMPAPTASWLQFVRPVLAAAASLLLFLYVYTQQPAVAPSGKNGTAHLRQSHTNTGKSNKLIRLEDGSAVLLTPGSSLLCDASFSDSARRVTLKGDAFFEIARDPSRPFFVFCEKITTRVLGTSFWIKSSNPEKAVEVTVHTGKVAVTDHTAGPGSSEKSFPKGETGFITLTPNEKASFTASPSASGNGAAIAHEVSVLKVGPPAVYAHRFAEIPLPDVFKSLADEYGLDIVMSSARVHDCTFTGDLAGLPLLDKLNLICFSTGTRYRIDDNRLIVSNEGCR